MDSVGSRNRPGFCDDCSANRILCVLLLIQKKMTGCGRTSHPGVGPLVRSQCPTHLAKYVMSVESRTTSNGSAAKEKLVPTMQRWRMTPQVAVSPAKMNLLMSKTQIPKMKKLLVSPSIMLQGQQVFAEAIVPDIPDRLSPQLESKDHKTEKWKKGLLQATC